MNSKMKFDEPSFIQQDSKINHYFTLSNDNKEVKRDVNISDLDVKIQIIKNSELDEVKIQLDESSTYEHQIKLLEKKHLFQNVDTHISTLAGCPKELGAFLSYSETRQTWERHSLYQMIKECGSWEGYLEILTKALIYREMGIGALIPAPNPNDPQKIDYYKIAQKIVTGKGFTADLLTPLDPESKLPSILVCSGSNFHPSGLDALSSYISDMEYNLGDEAYTSAVNELRALMQKIDTGSLIVTGHSLGGNLAQQIAARFPDKLQRVVTYNAPGVSKEVNATFKENSKELNGKLKIDIYQTSTDIVDLAGGLHIGYNNDKTEVSLTRFYLENPLTTFAHTYLCLANPCDLKIVFELFGKVSLSSDDLSKRECKKFEDEDASKMNPYLNNLGRDIVEFTRKVFGGLIVAPSLWALRWFVRLIIGTRANPTIVSTEI